MASWEGIAAGEPAPLGEVERKARAVLSAWGFRGVELEDLVQEVVAKVWEEAMSGKPEPVNFDAYLWNKCRAAAKTRRGERRRYEKELPTDPDDAARREGNEAERYLRELREVLAACRAAIPDERVRRAWELRYEVEPNRTAREVSERMEVPPGTIMSWWDRARRHLRRCLEHKGWGTA